MKSFQFNQIAWIILLITSSLSVEAQSDIDVSSSSNPKHDLRLGNTLLNQGYYYDAADYFLFALSNLEKESMNYRKACYGMGMASLASRNYSQAFTYLKEVALYTPATPREQKQWSRHQTNLFPLIHYHYGVAAKQAMQYDEATNAFNLFIESYDGKDVESMKSAAQVELEGIGLALLKIAPASLSIKPVQGVNGIYNEMGLAAWEDKLYFTSIATQSPLEIDQGQYSLYVQNEGENILVNGLITDPSRSIGSVAISDDGSVMVFSECLSEVRDNTSQCHLRLATRDDSTWVTKPAFSEAVNHENFTSTHPTIRQEDNYYVVYFASNKDLGKGGLDLYECILTDNGGVKGPNALHSVNTAMDDISPFYDQFTNRLYFSSNGYPSLGGFDIFYTAQDSLSQWRTPQNLMRPLNSQADDVFFRKAQGESLLDESERGYLISNREGTTFFKHSTSNDDIFVFDVFTFDFEGFVSENRKDGSFPLEQSTVVIATLDSLDEMINYDTLIMDESIEFTTALRAGRKYKITVEQEGFSKDEVEINTAGLTENAVVQHNFALNRVNAEIVGIARDASTKDPLSKTVVKLIDASSGATLSLQQTSENGSFSFDVNTAKEYRLEFARASYFMHKISTYVDSDSLSQGKLLINADLNAIQKDQAYAIDDVLFATGKADLSARSKEILDELIVTMQENPTLIIEMGSHTDDVGGDAMNLTLSQKRAEACVNYMVEGGIRADRLIARGYGEAVPIADNTSEKGRSKNRRTEFKVIGGL
ncbi:MAG: OmpA family protein [Bacteroidota bacterium]|nr:OmpA family protein [Bacteroidota bacterium]